MSAHGTAAVATEANASLCEEPASPTVASHDPETPVNTRDREALNESGDEPTSDAAEAALEKWNDPKVNACRFFVTLYCFIIMGMNDGAIGVSRQTAPTTGQPS